MLDSGIAKLGDFGQARLVGSNMSPYVATRWYALNVGDLIVLATIVGLFFLNVM